MDAFRDAEGSEGQEKSSPHLQVALRERISRFTCTMSTESIAVVIFQQPSTFAGLQKIGKIFFILDLVFFIGFTMLISIRFVNQPSALKHSLHHPQEIFFFGT
jgi:tellurite resistance protein TehA-like permease